MPTPTWGVADCTIVEEATPNPKNRGAAAVDLLLLFRASAVTVLRLCQIPGDDMAGVVVAVVAAAAAEAGIDAPGVGDAAAVEVDAGGASAGGGGTSGIGANDGPQNPEAVATMKPMLWMPRAPWRMRLHYSSGSSGRGIAGARNSNSDKSNRHRVHPERTGTVPWQKRRRLLQPWHSNRREGWSLALTQKEEAMDGVARNSGDGVVGGDWRRASGAEAWDAVPTRAGTGVREVGAAVPRALPARHLLLLLSHRFRRGRGDLRRIRPAILQRQSPTVRVVD